MDNARESESRNVVAGALSVTRRPDGNVVGIGQQQVVFPQINAPAAELGWLNKVLQDVSVGRIVRRRNEAIQREAAAGEVELFHAAVRVGTDKLVATLTAIAEAKRQHVLVLLANYMDSVLQNAREHRADLRADSLIRLANTFVGHVLAVEKNDLFANGDFAKTKEQLAADIEEIYAAARRDIKNIHYIP
jgi:hypothetical protein